MQMRFNLSNSNDGGGGIKGLIEAYKAHGVIDAGDFIQFIKGAPTTDISATNKQLVSTASHTYSGIDAVALNENRIFIVYGYPNNNYLYGMLCEISYSDITILNTTALDYTASAAEYNLSVAKLNENKVCLAYNYNICICTISGTTISKASGTSLNLGKYPKVVAINENKVIISGSAQYQQYISIGTINGTTISLSKTLISSEDNFKVMDLTMLNENLAFAVGRVKDGSYSLLYASLLVIDGVSVTMQEKIQIYDSHIDANTNNNNILTLNPNKVIIFWRSNDGYGFTRICEISNKTIILKQIMQLSSSSMIIKAITKVEEDTVVVFYGYSIGIMILTINGENVAIATNISSGASDGGYQSRAVTMSENMVIFIGLTNYTKYLNSIQLKWVLEWLAKAVKTKNEVINGVAITSAQNGEMVQVKVPGEE